MWVGDIDKAAFLSIHHPNCSFFASQTYDGIIYISNIYLILGGIAALTLFRKISGAEYKHPQILWIFCLILLPLGVVGLLFPQNFFD